MYGFGMFDFISENGSEIVVYSTSNRSGHFLFQLLKVGIFKIKNSFLFLTFITVLILVLKKKPLINHLLDE